MKIKDNILLRLFIGVFLFISIFIIPWWLFLVFSAILIFYFKFYIESVFLAIAFDLLYSSSNFFFGMDLLAIFVLILFVIIQVLKKKIIFY